MGARAILSTDGFRLSRPLPSYLDRLARSTLPGSRTYTSPGGAGTVLCPRALWPSPCGSLAANLKLEELVRSTRGEPATTSRCKCVASHWDNVYSAPKFQPDKMFEKPTHLEQKPASLSRSDDARAPNSSRPCCSPLARAPPPRLPHD